MNGAVDIGCVAEEAVVALSPALVYSRGERFCVIIETTYGPANGRGESTTPGSKTKPGVINPINLTHQFLEVLSILPAEAPICPPYPRQARVMSTTGRQKDNTIIRFHCGTNLVTYLGSVRSD